MPEGLRDGAAGAAADEAVAAPRLSRLRPFEVALVAAELAEFELRREKLSFGYCALLAPAEDAVPLA